MAARGSEEYLQAARRALIEDLATTERRAEKLRQQIASIEMALGATGQIKPGGRGPIDFSKVTRALDAIVLYLFHYQEGQTVAEVSKGLYKLGFRDMRKGSNIHASINTHLSKAEQSNKEPKITINDRGQLILTERGRRFAKTGRRLT
jgi:hypothetical protein